MSAHPQATDNPVPAWFHNRVLEGLQFLMSLGLEGTPAAEVIRLTATAWIQALWSANIDWQEPLDSHRLHRAFNDLAVRALRWPSPRVLLDHLPSRPQPRALPAPLDPVPDSVRQRWARRRDERGANP